MASLCSPPLGSHPWSQTASFVYFFLGITLRVRKWWRETNDKQIHYLACKNQCGELSHIDRHILRTKSLPMAFEILSNFVGDKIQPNLFTPRAFEGFRFEQKSKETSL